MACHGVVSVLDCVGFSWQSYHGALDFCGVPRLGWRLDFQVDCSGGGIQMVFIVVMTNFSFSMMALGFPMDCSSGVPMVDCFDGLQMVLGIPMVDCSFYT